ncbi:hypothetical protein BH10PAT3_BH10PAT3_0460 [soil metagenome]
MYKTHNICPVSGRPCEMAGWTADHLSIQYVVPDVISAAAVPAILRMVMDCTGSVDNCSPAGPDSLDNAVQLFNEALRTGRASNAG